MKYLATILTILLASATCFAQEKLKLPDVPKKEVEPKATLSPAAAAAFEFRGSAADQAMLANAISKFAFPWELMRPEMDKQGVKKIVVEYARLNDVEASALRERAALDGKQVRVFFHRSEVKPGMKVHAKAGIAGEASPGLLRVDNAYRGNQAETDLIVGSESAHEMDFFYLEPNKMHDPLNVLLYAPKKVGHPWWEIRSYSAEYFDLPGEKWMDGFQLAYGDLKVADDRWSSPLFTAAMAPKIREILKAERTDGGGIQPPPAGTAPVINSPLAVAAQVDAPFTYTITATNNPKLFAATNLPAGLTFSGSTISGKPTALGATTIALSAANDSGIGTASLVLTVSKTPVPPPSAADWVEFSVAGVVKKFELWPVGSKASAIKAREDQIKRLQDEIDGIKKLNEPAPEPPAKMPKGEPTMSYADWMRSWGIAADTRMTVAQASALAREYESLYGSSKP